MGRSESNLFYVMCCVLPGLSRVRLRDWYQLGPVLPGGTPGSSDDEMETSFTTFEEMPKGLVNPLYEPPCITPSATSSDGEEHPALVDDLDGRERGGLRGSKKKR